MAYPRRAAPVPAVGRLTETAADDAVNMLVHLIAHDLIGRARRKTEGERSATFPDLAHSAAVMREVGKVLLDARHETRRETRNVDTVTGENIPPAADTVTVREFLDQLADLPAFEAAVTLAGALAPAMGSDSEEARRAKMIKRINLLKTYLPHIVGGLARCGVRRRGPRRCRSGPETEVGPRTAVSTAAPKSGEGEAVAAAMFSEPRLQEMSLPTVS